MAAVFERLGRKAAVRPATSADGYVLFASNLPATVAEADLLDVFAAYGGVRQLTLTLDRAGQVVGHAMISVACLTLL